MQRISALLRMYAQMEGRSAQGLATAGAFVLSICFTIYMSLETLTLRTHLSAEVWMLLFWIITLFTALYIVHHLGLPEKEIMLFYYVLGSSLQIGTSWILYVFLVLLGCAGFVFCIQSLLLGYPITEITLFIGTIGLSMAGCATILGLLSLMISKVYAHKALFLILSLPLLIPLSVFTLRALSFSLEGAPQTSPSSALGTLLGFVLLISALAYAALPYIWKS